MKKRQTKYYTLLLLVLMFIAPGFAAYIFYQHPTWLGSSTVNKGTLLNPPLALTSITGPSKWRIVYWNPGECGQDCVKQLDILARVRLALGRKLYQVDQWLMLNTEHPALAPQINDILKEHDFHVANLSATEVKQLATLPSSPRVFIVSPEDYLILSYQSGVNPDDVYKDLKLLLNTTETKNG